MQGKITKDGYRIIDHGQGCIEVEDRGFSVLINPYPGMSGDIGANIVFTHRKLDSETIERLGSSERFCVVVPDSISSGLDLNCDFEIVGHGETVDIFGVKLSYDLINDNYFKLIVEMADQIFCYLNTEESVKTVKGGINQPIDMLILSLGQKGLDIKDAVQTSVALKPEVVSPYFVGNIEDSKIRSLKAEIEDRNIEMYGF